MTPTLANGPGAAGHGSRLTMDPSELDEGALVARLRANEDEAFEILVRAHGGRMLAVARRYLDEEDARDAVQEAFLSAFRAIGRFDGRARLGTWLHRIVVNAALMRLRRPAVRREESIEPLLPRFLDDGHRADAGPAWAGDAEARIGRAETRALVREAIGRLPPTHRTVIQLRDIEGLSGAQAGERLGISANAVKVRLHRARQALRELLDPALRGAVA